MRTLILLALGLVYSVSGFARGPVYQLEVALDAPSSHALYDALAIVERQVNGHRVKRVSFDLGERGLGHAIRIKCARNYKESYCKVKVEWPHEFSSGQTLTVPQWMAEALTSAIRMTRRTDLGEWWRSFESSDGRFGVLCEQVYTPSDLPFYTRCQVRLVRMPWDSRER